VRGSSAHALYNKLIVAVVVTHPAERGTLPGRLWRANDTQFLFAVQPKSLEQRPGSFILGVVGSHRSSCLDVAQSSRIGALSGAM
jgi:hypothetical protein